MKSLRPLFIAATVGVTFLVFALVIGYNLIQFDKIIKGEVKNELKVQAEKEATAFNSRLLTIGRVNVMSAKNIQSMPKYDTGMLLRYDAEYIQLDDMILGAGFWMEPRKYDPSQEYYGPYIYKDGGQLVTTWDYSNAQYNYFQYEWYKEGLKAVGRVSWSEPYLDTVSGIPMMTSSSAIIKNGQPVGVTTVDIGLGQLRDAVQKIKVGQTGYAFIVTKQGFYLGHKVADKNLKLKITEEKDQQIKQLGAQIIGDDKAGVAEAQVDGKPQYVVYAPIGDSGMKLVMYMPTTETSSGFNLTGFTLKNVGVFIVAMALLGFLISTFITRRISVPLGYLVKAAEGIAQGNLSVDLGGIKTNDEIGAIAKAFSTMDANLKDIIGQISMTSQSVAATSEQLSANGGEATRATHQVAQAINQVAKGADEQAREVTEAVQMVNQVAQAIEQVAAGAQEQNRNVLETSTLVDEMVEKIGAMAQGMETVRQISEENGAVAETGGKAVDCTVKEMLQVKGAVLDTANRIHALGEQSQKIGEIILVIDEIAEQTNLLALNAAIEAARAGEHGKGFAVVADEVRKLAERSGKATKEIAQLVTDIQKGTRLAVESMQIGTKEVEAGVQIAEEAGTSLDKIVNGVKVAEENVNRIMVLIKQITDSSQRAVTSVNKVAAITQENTAVTQQMAASTGKVSHSIESVASISEESASAAEEVSASTQELTASIEEMSGSSDQLAKMALELQSLVSQFKM